MENVTEQVRVQGVFGESLQRNFKQIREDRANIMTRSSLSLYKGKIDKLYLEMDKLEIDRNNLLDFAGDSTTRILSLDQFDAEAFCRKDEEITLKMRELKIRIEELTDRFFKLFGREYRREF